ncbi:DNRLRE domain-containing protein [Micromonospora sp. WMMD882]|uniref:DNRLRE domain-containing protein n=1 Tax=Micromonospora sp. WMMD882 TaxID=3015151 RepID=UPI00248B8EA6|nr:DNRLRE domain-containing protein [Micromonospora sp. WMMD882]WBB80431.1 DNRLRE domain-containing protein [Micromonospora sp. WMMD882]
MTSPLLGAPAHAAVLPPQAAASAATPSAAADEAAAAELAYRTRKPILVTGATTETSRAWAYPDGTFSAELHAAPVRARVGTGQWVDVDLTLRRLPDGNVAPAVDANGLWLSGARDAATDVLAVAGSGEQRVELGWTGALPEPQLDGVTATYAEVKPGVDLVVEARRTGFQYSFTVKDATAAATMQTISLPWSTGPSGDRNRAANAPTRTATVSQGEMWDARSLPSGDPAHRAEVEVVTAIGEDGGQELVMTPDPGFYEDSQLTYPVTIDPSVNLAPGFDAYVQNTIATTDKSGDTELRLGYSDDGGAGCSSGCTARSLLNFQRLGGLDGATVISAELFLWNFYSWSCTAASWESWRVSWANSSARWGNQPAWLEQDGTSTGTKGYGPNCADGWVSVSVKKSFQAAFDSAEQQWANIGLRATSESNHNGWKKFNSSEAATHTPYVTLKYNRTPNSPTSLKIDSCYSACTSPAVVRSGTPQLAATVSDPDTGTLRAEYQVYNSTKGTLMAKSGTAVTGVSSGTARPWRVVPLTGAALADGTYHWRVKACDAYLCGDYSAWFTFTVNTQDPSLPAVSSSAYPEKSTGGWNGGPGQPGSFTYGPGGATEVAEYVYQLNGDPLVTVPAGTPQTQLLTTNQQQVSSGLTGFTAGQYATISRSTARGHQSQDSLQVTPAASGTAAGAAFAYATVGGEWSGGFHLGMQAGRRYWVTGWVYVPGATGLNPTDWRGLAIVPTYHNAGAYTHVLSSRPTATDTWQRLSVVLTVPVTATEAFVRLYNGFAPGTGKSVFWDDLSVREVTGTTTAETITPARDGLNVLAVQSRTAAGATSDPRVYQFLVNPSTDSWHWTLDDATGTAASSVPGNTRPAALSGSGVTWQPDGRVGGAVTTDGSGQLTTSSPVLDTNAPEGFTVAAWVRLTDLASPHAAVSQDGTTTSLFRLGLRTDVDVDGDGAADPAWCFTLAQTDSGAANQTAACTADYVVDGDWVSLVGVYDRPTSTIRLYVNGTPDLGGSYAEAAHTTPWSATGPLALARALDAGAAAERWVGDLDHVYASQGVWGPGEVIDHAFA